MKVGCHVSTVQEVRAAPYAGAVETIARMGFDGAELIAMDQTELTEYYTDSTVDRLRRQIQTDGIEVSQFALYSNACDGLASLDATRRAQAVEIFDKAIEVCRRLDAPLVNLVSHWPDGLRAPHPYPPAYLFPIVTGIAKPVSPKFQMELPADYDAAAIWDNYVESIGIVAQRCADKGLTLTIEGHAHVIVSGTDAMLRLFDHVQSDHLAANFDTAWHLLQREYIAMSVRKLGNRLAHVHCRDGDGLLYYDTPIGQGIIDWPDLTAALRTIGYEGYLSLEYPPGFPRRLDIAAESRKYLHTILSDTA